MLDDQAEDIRAVIDKFSSLEIRQVGIDAEQTAINYVFPQCSTKLFRIRSLFALETFLKDPIETAATTDLCSTRAHQNWEMLSLDERENVRSRMLMLKQCFPGLRDSIDDLKFYGAISHPHNFETYITSQEENMEIVEALQLCWSTTEAIKQSKWPRQCSEIDDSRF